ncbi:MAG: hypothetical protein WDN69_09290, partial [Aliidongia sp.]
MPWRHCSIMASACIAALVLIVSMLTTPAQALSCTANNGLYCTAFADPQYAGGFNPGVGDGGFGGASNCTVTHTPVVFIHGNGDSAYSLAMPPTTVSGYPAPPASVYQALKAAGYQDCEIFGVNYLNASERSLSQDNYMQESKYQIINSFIQKVKTYTKASQVDIVAHSLGVSQAIAAMDYSKSWGNVRRFVAIAGGLHGLQSCFYVGDANAAAPTCGGMNIFDNWIFGNYADSDFPGSNPWTSASSRSTSLPQTPITNPKVTFYSLNAGTHDEIMCATETDYSTCGASPLFNSAANVLAQLDIGAGANTQEVNWNWATGLPTSVFGGDADGIGHFMSKNNAGAIIVQMLTTSCTGIGCASTYASGPVTAD